MTRAAADRRPAKPRAEASPEPSRQAEGAEAGGMRETIEGFVVAFVLAGLIRGFVAEAFVIPTGSMAPTLYGRHKEIDCPQCGVTFAVNAADEARNGGRVTFGTCYNCRYRTRVDEEPSHNGDRILVMKFPYDLPWLPLAGGPERWDVVVFHYPEAPEQNYIKRLVGLPGEELRVWGGDLHSRPLGTDEPFRILRKPPRHLRAMLIPVFDDRHRPEALEGSDDWRRWRSIESGDWTVPPESGPGTYEVDATEGDRPAWLRYYHLAPNIWQWREIALGNEPGGPLAPSPALIADFSSYNTNQSRSEVEYPPMIEAHWVGDLALEFVLDVETAGGEAIVELIEGGVPYRCVLDLGDGTARLAIDGEVVATSESSTGVDGPGRHRVAFANVDDRLTLWVDGSLVFGDGVPFERGSDAPPTPAAADLSPAGVALDGASGRVSDLVLKRDIYYTKQPNESDYGRYRGGLSRMEHRELRDALSDPGRFDQFADQGEPRVFPIRPGHYMMMGDNSPRSKDGRAWGQLDRLGGTYYDDANNLWRTKPWSDLDRAYYEVPAEHLIGKAFFIYWPHGKPFGPDIRLGPDFRIPFRPYVERMRWIR